MGCIVSKHFLDFYIFFIFTRPLWKWVGGSSVQLEIKKNRKTNFYTLFYYVFGRAFERQQRYKCSAMTLLLLLCKGIRG